MDVFIADTYMVIKIIFLLFLTSFVCWAQEQIPADLKKENTKLLKAIEEDSVKPEKFSDEIKGFYWQSYKTLGDEILSKDKIDSTVKSTQDKMLKLKEPLVALEFQEEETDEYEEKVNTHLKLLNDKIYGKTFSIFIDYISWQNDATLKTASGDSELIITNHGFCAGGSWGYKNAFYHAFLDGCLLQGYGNVGSEKRSVTYKQSNVPSYGLKASLGAGMTVSSLGAEVGLKLPILYTIQSLDDPNQVTFPGSKVEEGSPLRPLASLYSRWPFEKWFVETEFAHALDKDLTFWGVGLGRKF